MANILIVDDEPQIVRLLSAVLVGAGHEVRTAHNPQVAIEMCSPPSCFDLVLSDVSMPVLDGHELARWIADRCPSSRTILVSESAAGCQDCPYEPHCPLVLKPFNPKAVLAAVASALASPMPLKCPVAQLLLTHYSTALNRFYNLPAIMLEKPQPGEPDYDAAQQQKEAAYVALLAARAEYRTHIHQHGCKQPTMAIATYEQIKNRLERELRQARAVFDDASDKLQRLSVLMPEVELHSEGRQVLQDAKRLHQVAQQVYMMTLQRFSDFIRDEILPAERGGKPS
jgi:CheY-like chemotaxis protein